MDKQKFEFGAGRPPEYATAEELQAKIVEYFDKGVLVKKKILKDGFEIDVPYPTITGLTLYCGFESRQSFYDYEKKPAFTYTIKKARLFIEKEYEQLLQDGVTAAIFALKNMNWVDKQELDNPHRFPDKMQVEFVDPKNPE